MRMLDFYSVNSISRNQIFKFQDPDTLLFLQFQGY